MLKPTVQVDHSHGVCALTGRKLEEGEEFHSVLFEEGESFRRADYSLEAWSGPPEGAFCHFKTRVPVKQKRKRLLVDDDILVAFFHRLASEAELVRVQFRFVLALILMRKRKLKYVRTLNEGGHEIWVMTFVRDEAEQRVVNPQLTDAQIDGVSRELTAILHGDAGQWATELQESAEAVEAVSSAAGSEDE